MKKIFYFISLALFLHSAFAASAQAETPYSELEKNDTNLYNFIEEKKSKIVDVLEMIRAHEMTENNRFIILSAVNDVYVQCLYHNNDKEIYCETSSGFYQKPRPALSTSELNSLGALNFQMDSREGNFKFGDIKIIDRNSLNEVATLMLKAIYESYKVRPGSIKITSPLVLENPINL